MKNSSQKVLSGFARKIGIASFILLFLSFVFVSQASAQLINEIALNPAGTDQPCEYIEIVGTPGATIAANTYYVEIDGDTPGVVNMVVNLSGLTYGTNGLITIAASDACGTRSYAAGGSTVVTDTQLNAGGSGIQNGTGSFLIVTSSTPIVEETDYDTNNDGILEGSLASATVIDSIAVTDSGASDRTYAPVLSFASGSTNVPDAFVRFGGNTTANSSTAFFFGDLTGTQSGTTFSNTRSTNFPSGGALTPGIVNATTAAGATIAGRIVSSNGRGISNVRIMLTGGSLSEPIYATSTSFGYYQFPEVPAGDTYILQVFSKNYIFDSSSMVVNLTESLTEANFTGRLRGLASSGR